MALPKIQDLITYVSKVITGADWNTNWQTVVSWLSSGNTDIKVKSIELSASGGITNNGSFAQSGDMNINGNLIVTNDITANKFNGDGSGLTGIVSSATVAYTPFAVNSGNVDTNGLGDILYYTGGSGTLKFKVGGTLPTYDSIIATSAQGVTFTLTQILDLDVSTYDDGTYTVCIKKNQTVAEIKGTLYSQLTTPAGLNNDLWLNTSVEKLKCYEKIAGSWNNEYEGIPIGTVTIASGVITAVTTNKYNQNNYNLNINTNIPVGFTKYALENLQSGTLGTSYPTNQKSYIIKMSFGAISSTNLPVVALSISSDNINWTVIYQKQIDGTGNGSIVDNYSVADNLYFKVEAIANPGNLSGGFSYSSIKA